MRTILRGAKFTERLWVLCTGEYIVPLSTAQHFSHYLRIHSSWKKRGKMIHASSSSASSCDSSHVPFCSFCFFSCDFSASFSSSSPLRQMMTGTCCASFSFLWSPRHSMTKQIWHVNKQNFSLKCHQFGK